MLRWFSRVRARFWVVIAVAAMTFLGSAPSRPDKEGVHQIVNAKPGWGLIKWLSMRRLLFAVAVDDSEPGQKIVVLDRVTGKEQEFPRLTVSDIMTSRVSPDGHLLLVYREYSDSTKQDEFKIMPLSAPRREYPGPELSRSLVINWTWLADGKHWGLLRSEGHAEPYHLEIYTVGSTTPERTIPIPSLTGGWGLTYSTDGRLWLMGVFKDNYRASLVEIDLHEQKPVFRRHDMGDHYSFNFLDTVLPPDGPHLKDLRSYGDWEWDLSPDGRRLCWGIPSLNKMPGRLLLEPPAGVSRDPDANSMTLFVMDTSRHTVREIGIIPWVRNSLEEPSVGLRWTPDSKHLTFWILDRLYMVSARYS